jgi:FkbM family methyltransferase
VTVNQRLLRRHAGLLLPEFVKRLVRHRLFGFRAAAVETAWSIDGGEDHVALRTPDLVARFPKAAESSLHYHCLENGDSIEELYGFLEFAKTVGGTLYDVGAADGLFSTLFCLSAPGNRAVAFEPSASMGRHVTEVVELNGLASRVELVNAAVGRASGTANASLNDDGMMIVGASGNSSKSIPLVSLDGQLSAREPPTAVKIDVEGYEGEVLFGARKLIETHFPVLFLEFHLDMLENKGVRVGDLLDFLFALGYRFQSSLGAPLSPSHIVGSPKSILRFVARPSKFRKP